MQVNPEQGLNIDGPSPQQPRRRRHAKTQTTEMADGALRAYMRAMGNHVPFTAEQEQRAAVGLQQARVARWSALLSYPPLVPAIRVLIEARMQVNEELTTALTQLETDAEQFRVRRTLANEAQFSQICAELGERLPELDLDSELAELLIADVERIGRNQREGLSVEVVRMPGDSRPFRIYLAACRASERHVRKLTNDFVKANLRLVVNLARRLAHGRLPLQDVIQEGNIGLLKAVERFDHRRGFRFSTYASWWIRHAVSRGIYNKGRQVRLPVHVHDVQQKLTRIRRSHLAQHGHEPSVETLAEAIGLPQAKVESVLRLGVGSVVSLDAPGSGTDGRAPLDLLEDEDGQPPGWMLEAEELERGLGDAIAQLRPMEAEILRLRYGLRETEPKTLREIGEQYALSRERIRQLQERAVANVREEFGRMQLL